MQDLPRDMITYLLRLRLSKAFAKEPFIGRRLSFSTSRISQGGLLSAISSISFYDGGEHEVVPLTVADTCKVLQSTAPHRVKMYPNLLMAAESN